MKNRLPALVRTLCILTGLGAHEAVAWDYEAHFVINQLALASLPTNFPAFVSIPANRERIAFLAGEPDRWRNSTDLELRHVNAPDHYIDLEELGLYGLKPEALPTLRYDFVEHIAVARAQHAGSLPSIDSTKDPAHTRNLIGFLPWTIAEYAARLKSSFSYLKAYEKAGGTSDEIANSQANVVYTMGVMGHFVGDASQPLHTTVYFNGWTGDNPHGFTTNHTFHAWIDGGYFRATGGLKLDTLIGQIRPAERMANASEPEGVFRAVVAYIKAGNEQVEPLYQLEKEGKLSGEGQRGLAGKAFLDEQMVKAGQMLGNIWCTAWMDAPEDTYLERQLRARHSQTSTSTK